MNWNIIARQYRARVVFKTQTQLALFVLEMAKLADEKQHHPDFSVLHCNELNISVYSHDALEITQRDHDLVQQISNLYDEFFKKG